MFMKPFIRRALVVLAFLLGALVGVRPAHAQGALPAATGCIGDSIVTLFREDVQKDTLAMQELDAHEAVHRAQIKAAEDSLHLSCVEAFWTLTGSPLLNLMSEVPAYRAQGQWLAAHRGLTYNPDAFFDFVAKALYESYEGRLPYDFIHAYLVLGRNPGLDSLPVGPPQEKPHSYATADSLLQNLHP